MKLEEAKKLIQAEIDDEDLDWESPLGEAYHLAFEAVKVVIRSRQGDPPLDGELLPGETDD